MKDKIKLLLNWAMTFAICFIVIYLFVFLGGWKLFESGDPILIEVAIALVLSFFVFWFNRIVTGLETRVKLLEGRLTELETNSKTIDR